MNAVSWSSGPWSLERRDGTFAYVRYAGTPVLRAVQAVVRDHDWGTVPLEVSAADGGTLRVRTPELHGTVSVAVSGNDLTISCDLVADAAFRTNRTGLVVLHPYQLAGTPLTVTHPSGIAEELVFPESISPHQPARDIAGLAWTHDGLRTEVRFDGDVFEMEDQRNWTDASYKTYSRPLSLPFPYTLAVGERVRQTVTVSVTALSDVIELSQGPAFPAIVIGASTAPDPAPSFAPAGAEVLVELDLATPNWRAALDRAASSGLPLDVRLIVSAGFGAEIADAAVRLKGLPVARVAGFDAGSHVTDAGVAAAVRTALGEAGIEAPVVGGARSHFTELNREQDRIPGDLDGLVFATTPLFHDLGTAQLIESVAIQRIVAEQGVAIARGRPVHVGPIALRPRFNNVATAPAPAPVRDDLADGYGARFTGASDPRQAEPWLGAWTIASAAALAVPGVESLAYFEEWGPRGVDGLPVAGALRELTALGGKPRLWGASPDGLIWAVGAGDRVLVANLDEKPRTITIVTGSDRHTAAVGPRQWQAWGGAG
ncbi:hypothetical protein [Actinoplanes sp. NPDC051851]|uniref:hypothetical protein n=1 Tax=Actinoplanes sp. NPDC051851 TaxID=3154753 RepID=UPI00341DFDC3